jgi:hypothetical protein
MHEPNFRRRRRETDVCRVKPLKRLAQFAILVTDEVSRRGWAFKQLSRHRPNLAASCVLIG